MNDQVASTFIHEEYGEEYAALKPRKTKLSEGAQDAHEAIRKVEVVKGGCGIRLRSFLVTLETVNGFLVTRCP